MDWGGIHQHGIGQRFYDANGIDPPRNPDGQAFAGELVDQRHQTDPTPVVGLGLDKVEAPDMIGIFWSQPDAGTVVEPKTGPIWLLLRDFQPLCSDNSDATNVTVIDTAV